MSGAEYFKAEIDQGTGENLPDSGLAPDSHSFGILYNIDLWPQPVLLRMMADCQENAVSLFLPKPHP